MGPRRLLDLVFVSRTAIGLLATAALAGCNPLPGAVRPTIDWLTNHGLACAYAAPDVSGLAQWTCRASANGARYVVTVDGNEHGVDDVIGQVQGVDATIGGDAVASFLTDVVIGAPPSADAAARIDAWVRANPASGQTTIDGIRVTLDAVPGRTTLALVYPPAPGE